MVLPWESKESNTHAFEIWGFRGNGKCNNALSKREPRLCKYPRRLRGPVCPGRREAIFVMVETIGVSADDDDRAGKGIFADECAEGESVSIASSKKTMIFAFLEINEYGDTRSNNINSQ